MFRWLFANQARTFNLSQFFNIFDTLTLQTRLWYLFNSSCKLVIGCGSSKVAQTCRFIVKIHLWIGSIDPSFAHSELKLRCFRICHSLCFASLKRSSPTLRLIESHMFDRRVEKAATWRNSILVLSWRVKHWLLIFELLWLWLHTHTILTRCCVESFLLLALRNVELFMTDKTENEGSNLENTRQVSRKGKCS